MADVFEPMISDIPDLTGKVALVTGANSPNGIGFHTAFWVAAKGATVYVGARDTAKAKYAIDEMRKKDKSIREDQLRPFVVDLGDLKAVQKAAEKLMTTTDRLDILINNAGLLPRPLDIDSDGISVGFKTNHLAPFVLTTTLLSLLKRTAAIYPGVRVVSVASSTHAIPPAGIRFDSLSSFNAELGGTDGMPSNLDRYGLSKLANVLFANQLQKIFNTEGSQVISLSLHPGEIKTDGSIKFVGPENLALLSNKLSPAQGALTSIFAATSPKIWSEKEIYGGAYLVPFGKLETPSENAQNAGLAEELWATSVHVVKSVLEA